MKHKNRKPEAYAVWISYTVRNVKVYSYIFKNDIGLFFEILFECVTHRLDSRNVKNARGKVSKEPLRKIRPMILKTRTNTSPVRVAPGISRLFIEEKFGRSSRCGNGASSAVFCSNLTRVKRKRCDTRLAEKDTILAPNVVAAAWLAVRASTYGQSYGKDNDFSTGSGKETHIFKGIGCKVTDATPSVLPEL
jgi:hypothetical protein